MKPPLISVIIPTRNRAELLSQALKSFSNQTLAKTDFEILVIDDGSKIGRAHV
jgi:glycosyltransferase involved in cell wall biosynthesis